MKKILVVVDMQNDFTSGCLGNDRCQAVIPKIVELINSKAYDSIMVTRDTHFENYMQSNEGKHLPVEHCIENTDGWKVVEPIQNALDKGNVPVTYFDKTTFGSKALGTVLEAEYEKYNMQMQIDFVGVCTGICVISNVLLTKAHCPESEIRVIENACACVTKESHNTAIAAMKMCHIEII